MYYATANYDVIDYNLYIIQKTEQFRGNCGL